jgi:penicillin-binding protein 1A
MNPRNKAVNNKGSKKAKKRPRPAVKFIFTVLKILLIFIIALSCAVAGMMGGAIYGFVKTAQPIRDEQLQVKILTTFIYDSEGNEIATLTGKENKNRELVYFSDIPQYLKDAFVAVEDERFYKHKGIDLKRIASAVFGLLTSGRIEHGGSTITQQVVRNITGKDKISLQRKVQEQWNAIQLEKRMQKWQILELYMNIIYFGNSCYGVQSASKLYFDKDVKDLSLAQCAYLAGITNNPSWYNPLTAKGHINAKKRQELILKLMLEQGKIDENEYEQAMKENIKIASPDKNEKKSTTQTYFVDQVILDVKRDLMKERGMSEDMALTTIYNYGLKIYTTQDSRLQKIMDEVFQNDEFFPKINKKAIANLEDPQAAMVIVDPETGQVKAMYGGYGKKQASNTLNRATQIARQPGSSIKPIAVYAPALDLGLITPATVVDDVPVYMLTGKDKNTPYPKNYDHAYDGLTTVRNGTKASINVVAAKVWKDILGPDHSIEYLKKVGIDREEEKHLAIALGGLYKGVSPLQMAAAYVPFVHKGMYYEPYTYTRVEDSDGNILLEKEPQYHTAYNETTAFLMTDMLKEVCKPKNSTYPRGGTAASRISEKSIGMPVAGKTGTTSDNRDKWFVGFTPYYVAATWYGYDNRIKPIELVSEEYNQAQLIWQAVMKKAHENLPVKDFEVPSGLVKRRICIYSGKLAGDLCSKDPRGNATREEYFIKGTEPRYDEVCDVHVKASVCKDSQDIWGRNLLSGDYCPLESIIEKVFIQRNKPYKPRNPGDKYPKDWVYELPEGEYCPLHGAPAFEENAEDISEIPDLNQDNENGNNNGNDWSNDNNIPKNTQPEDLED